MNSSGPILVTGAAGKTGRAVVHALRQRGAAVRALFRRPDQTEAFAAYGADEVIVGDMRDADLWTQALRGAHAMYLICPNMASDEPGICDMALAAACETRIERVVYHSVLHPQIEAMTHHWNKLRVEERLFESNLRWTVMQPAAYTQNVFAEWDAIERDGVYRVPYAPETELGMVDLGDVAEVAARVLIEPGHDGAIYELAGQDILAQTDVARILEQELKRPVRAEQIPREEWARSAREAGLGEWQVQTLLAMFQYYERHGFWGNPHVLGWLLGRPPTPFAQVVAREVLTR